jgi:hypothetical protein
MTTLMLYALLGYMVGVIIERFVHTTAGLNTRVIAAILFVLFWIFGFTR